MSPKVAAIIVVTVALIGMLIYWAASEAEAQACGPSTVVAIGGVNDGASNAFPPGSVDVRVRYSGNFNDLEGGVNAFGAAVAGVRNSCPGTKIVAAGYSQGATIVHYWLQRNPGVPNKVGVLFSDPKLAHTGLMFWETDANFGGAPTVTICRRNDIICARQGNYNPEHFLYDLMPKKYAGQNGVVWQ